MTTTLTSRAAMHDGRSPDLEIVEVDVAPPGAGQVRVHLRASGVCGSDRHVLDGDWTLPSPTIMGHEGAGVVESVGEGVSGLDVGDHVVLTWFYPCQVCRACREGRPWVCTGSRSGECVLPDGSTPQSREGEPVYPYLAVGSMGEYTVVPEQAAVRIPEEVPFDVASLIGCSVATGVGAVVNDAQVTPGRPAVVLGAGGVGLCVVMGLALAGAWPVVALDVSDEALGLARRLGASHTLDMSAMSQEEVETRVHRLSDGGAEYAFEAIGRVETLSRLPRLLRRGGTGVVVGLPPQDSPVALDLLAFAENGQRLLGSNYGSVVPSRDFPLLAQLYLAGRLPVDDLITGRYDLGGVNDAFARMRAGALGRSVIVH